jgi:hypothetical protein
MSTHAVDSRYAWGRLSIALALMTVGSNAMWNLVNLGIALFLLRGDRRRRRAVMALA